MLVGIPQLPLALVVVVVCLALLCGDRVLVSVEAQSTTTTTTAACQNLWNHFVGPSNNRIDSCCNVTYGTLHVGCNDQQEITTLDYSSPGGQQSSNNDSNSNKCNNATLPVLSELVMLEHLTLNYYVDQTACPSFFSFALFNNLTRLSTLAIRGTQFLSSLSGDISNNTTNNNSSVRTLDLSDSNMFPSWIRDMFPSVNNLIMLGNSWQQSSSSNATFTAISSFCKLLSNLTLDVTSMAASTTSTTASNSTTWLSSCTNLTQLDIRLDLPNYDVSEWLGSIIPPLSALQNLTVIASNSQRHATFPIWLSQLTHLSSLTYHASIVDRMPSNVLASLPLTELDLAGGGNGIYGDLPDALSSVQLSNVDLSGNDLSGKIPAGLSDTGSCDLDGNPIMCSGIGNSWDVCQHCNLVPGFGSIMRRYMIQWIVIGTCLFLILCIWTYITMKKHQQTSFAVWLSIFYSAFSAVNLFTTIVHLGLRIPSYTTSFCVLVVTTIIYLLVNAYLYRYCCRRFSILVIRRTWPVFLFCTLDLNNFGLYEIRMLNLSAYRLPIDHRVPTVLSWIKVLIADVPHTAVAIFLMMLHAPVASVLLTCITSGLGIVRAIVQIFMITCLARSHRRFHPMTRSSPGDDEDEDHLHHHDHCQTASPGSKDETKFTTAESSIPNNTRNDQVELTHLIK